MKRTPAQRKRDQRAGIVTLHVRVDVMWMAEALALAGFGHADDDGRLEVQAKLQALVDHMVAEAKG